MKKKTVNEAWGDERGRLFPVDNKLPNRSEWFSWLPNVLVMNTPKGISGLPFQLWVTLNHLARNESTCRFSIVGLGKILERSRNPIRAAIQKLVKAGMIAASHPNRRGDGLYNHLLFDVGPGRRLLLRKADEILAKREGRDTDASWAETGQRSEHARERLMDELFGIHPEAKA